MRAWCNQQLRFPFLALFAAWLTGCGKPAPPVAPPPAPEPVVAPTSNARIVPRRTNILVVTNVMATNATAAAVVSNTAPVVTCGSAPSIPCSSADGMSVTLTAQVHDVDGDALSVIWNIDGRDRYTEQVAAGGPPTSADLSFSYNFTPGEHRVKVTAQDGSLAGSCELSISLQRDTQEPVIACPADITTVPDPGRCTAVVTYSPKATDNCPDVAVVCEPPPGTAFAIGMTPVECTATDTAGNVSVCAFQVNVQFLNRCPQNDGFWRQNQAAWPVNSIHLGNYAYTRSQLLPLLRATVPADASMVLARQLIVATLNTANGSDPRPICNELAQANAALASFSGKLPYRVNVSTAVGRNMAALAARLNGYNSGMMTANCIP